MLLNGSILKVPFRKMCKLLLTRVSRFLANGFSERNALGSRMERCAYCPFYEGNPMRINRNGYLLVLLVKRP